MSRLVLTRLAGPVEQQVRRHCEAQYPHEACGALFGEGDGTTAAWRVTEVKAAPNEHAGDLKRRYLVPPGFQLQAERHAFATGQDVLGYYHSHPDHPAQPSDYDREHAWAGYLYLICSVQRGCSTALNAFAVAEQGGPFLDVQIQGEPVPTE
jgi:proteasome lid subunit RPN8/RPN11